MVSVCGLAFCVWWWGIVYRSRSHRASRRDEVCDRFCGFLCEIFYLLTMINFSHAKTAESAKFYFPFRISRLRWSGRKLRYDKSAQRVLSTPSPLRGTTPVSGVESVTTDGYTPYNLPLRPPSRVASDYFSDSVVCIEFCVLCVLCVR